MGTASPPNRNAQLPRRLPARRALAWTAFAGGLVGGIASLGAADSSAPLRVSATVNPIARLEQAPPAPLLISAADLQRGYVDAPRPLRLRVYSNSRAGFALDVAAQSPWFTAVAIDGLDTGVTLGAEGGTIVQRWPGAAERSLSLRVRFSLAAGLEPGLYAWPLQLRARPL
jgi:hypothetical protein